MPAARAAWLLAPPRPDQKDKWTEQSNENHAKKETKTKIRHPEEHVNRGKHESEPPIKWSNDGPLMS